MTRPFGGEQAAVAGVARGQHAIHHVDAAGHVFGQLVGHADAHGVARPVARQHGFGRLHHFQAERTRLAHRKAADGVAVGIEIEQGGGAFAAQVGEHGALHDGEQGVARGASPPCARGSGRRPARPSGPCGAWRSRAYSWLTGYSGHSSSTIMMSLPKASWTSTVDSGVNGVGVAIQVRVEDDAVFGDLAQTAEAEDLEAAGIGQDGAAART